MREILDKHGKFANIIPSFGLEQGTDDHGKPKYRRIDDHTAGHTNLASERTQKIQMSMVDYVMVMFGCAAKQTRERLLIGTEDMAGAYRQVPLLDSQVSISITAVYNPHRREVEFFELFGQPFGAAAAVPNFYRLAEWMSRLLTRAYRILLDQFFDDFFVVLRESEAETTMFLIRESFQLLGLTLDPEKSQAPAAVAMVLGVAFNAQSLQSQRILRVEPKPTRVSNLCFIIDRILQVGSLSPTLAASVLGKFGFLCSTLFGKVGRCCTGALRARQYGSPDDHSLTADIITCLKLMKIFAVQAPRRELHIDHSDPPLILYTDASDVPDRTDGRWMV